VIRVAHELPRPLQLASVSTRSWEYPSACFLTATIALVADGHGSLYCLHISDDTQAFELSTTGMGSLPFKIHDAVAVSPDLGVAILSSHNYNTAGAAGAAGDNYKTRGPVEYDIWSVQFPLTAAGSAFVSWRRRGESAPMFAKLNASPAMHLLIGDSTYRELYAPVPAHYEPAQDEFADIPRAGEDLYAMQVDSEKPPPYSWSQTSDVVTVAFALLSTTRKENITATFFTRSLMLRVTGEAPTALPVPDYTSKELWDDISPSSSYWTWDREAERTYGLLTLHLHKLHENIKWMQVFAKAGSRPSSEAHPEDVEVPETLDPSELWQIRESLEKFTAAVCEGKDASGLDLGGGVPSLADGEMDDDLDSSIGRQAFLTWVGDDGSAPDWAAQPQGPVTILSTPLPGSTSTETSFIVKTGLDGALISLKPADDPHGFPQWTHTATFSALSFVLASKQDVRFTHHVSSEVVLAFDGGVSNRGGGNIYIYRGHTPRDKWAKQSILRVGDMLADSLLGVGVMVMASGRRIVLGLSEGELILIDKVL
jgi:hypothetical protein